MQRSNKLQSRCRSANWSSVGWGDIFFNNGPIIKRQEDVVSRLLYMQEICGCSSQQRRLNNLKKEMWPFMCIQP